MNTIIVSRIPPGDFEEISILMSEWKTAFLNLVRQNKPIKFVTTEMPNIPKDIQDELNRRNYYDFVLENGGWQHFLIGCRQ